MVTIPTLILAVVMSVLPVTQTQVMPVSEPKVLAVHEFSLENRYPTPYVNDVFKDNILLTISYAVGKQIDPKDINWDNIGKPFKYTLSLKPGETFAFHEDVLPNYTGKVAKTTNAHFNASDGFKSDGYLMGDGVCHLASILYWVAKDAGLDTLAPTRHDFAPVPQVPQEFGVSIYNNGTKGTGSNQSQNLYITNNKDKTIAFVFDYNGDTLTVEAVE